MAGTMSEDGESETDKINVVPLADLSLVLLIILMVLSPMVMSSMIKVQAPKLDKVSKSKLDNNAKVPDPLLIKISVSGMTLNGNPIENDQLLAEQIAIKLSDEPDRPVIVSAEDNILVGDVVRILDLAKQSGAQKVSLLKGSREG